MVICLFLFKSMVKSDWLNPPADIEISYFPFSIVKLGIFDNLFNGKHITICLVISFDLHQNGSDNSYIFEFLFSFQREKNKTD